MTIKLDRTPQLYSWELNICVIAKAWGQDGLILAKRFFPFFVDRGDAATKQAFPSGYDKPILLTRVANQKTAVNLPCPIDAFQRRPDHVKGCPSLPKLIVNHESSKDTRMVMESVSRPHQPNYLREVPL